MTNICYLNKINYGESVDWKEFLLNNKTLDDIPYHTSWTILFSKLRKGGKYKQIMQVIEEEIIKDKRKRIYPKPEYVFSAFLICPANDLKVVFIGQDPYFKSDNIDDNKWAPQATGMSFSVADGFDIPSSLQNIFRNMIKYKHMEKMPESGDLWFWAAQGCLMLNTALTVRHDEKKSHSGMWKWFTDEIIQYISTYFNDIIFVLWGSDAYSKINLIDQDKHHTIISSHPSGLSAHKKLGCNPAFNDFDHFGEINRILSENNKSEILWK
jgi:uracil-DNA glycosylase